MYQIITIDKVIMNSPPFLLTASLDYLPKLGSSFLLPLRIRLPWAALKAQVSFALNHKPFPDTFCLWFLFVAQLCTWYIMSAAFQVFCPLSSFQILEKSDWASLSRVVNFHHCLVPTLGYCCRKGDPLQGPAVGFYLALRNELSEETHVLTKEETLLGRDTWAKSSRVRQLSRTALPCGLQSRVLWEGG